MLIAKRHKQVLIKTRHVEPLRKLIPHLKELEYKGHNICIPHGLEETRILRNIGLNVPSPILYHYDWPGQFNPYIHQKATAAFLTYNPRGYVLNGMGTGKTSAVLWAADYLMREGLVNKAAVVAPLSTLDTTWTTEVFNTLMHRQSVIVHGTAAKRLKLLKMNADFYVLNHDFTRVDSVYEALLARDDIDLYILDEGSVYRNSQTERWKRTNAIIKNKSRVWMMTATPASKPTHAYGLARMITPETVPKYYTQFERDTMVKVSDFRWVAKPDGMEKAFEALQPAIRYATEDCIDLPPITHVMRETEMSSHQKKSYDLMVKKMRMEYDDNVNAANAAVKMGKLLQIACGTVKNDDGDYIHLDPTPRLKLLLEILEEVPEHQKVLVFCPYVATVELVSSYFRKKSISHARIVSGVSAGRRKKIFKDFQTAADPRVLVATPGTMSHGLNLEQASTVVWYSAIHDEDTYTQANGRVARPSQKNHMHIVHIEGSRVEREVYQSLRDKHSTSQALLNMYQELKS